MDVGTLNIDGKKIHQIICSSHYRQMHEHCSRKNFLATRQ